MNFKRSDSRMFTRPSPCSTGPLWVIPPSSWRGPLKFTVDGECDSHHLPPPPEMHCGWGGGVTHTTTSPPPPLHPHDARALQKHLHNCYTYNHDVSLRGLSAKQWMCLWCTLNLQCKYLGSLGCYENCEIICKMIISITKILYLMF